jgi:predicted Zn-dependent peptidase
VYAAMDADFKDRIVDLVFQEIRKIKDVGITESQLKAAKQQLMAQIAISTESPLNEMQAMGKSFLNFGRVDSIDEINDDIQKIDCNLLKHIANEIFIEDNFSKLLYY